MNIKFIVMTILLFTILPKAQAQTGCTGCTIQLTGGGTSNITVTSGQTKCLVSGNFNPGSVSIDPGGTLCVSSGVTLIIPGNLQSGTIENHGKVTITQMQNYNGTLNNSGMCIINGYFNINGGHY